MESKFQKRLDEMAANQKGMSVEEYWQEKKDMQKAVFQKRKKLVIVAIIVTGIGFIISVGVVILIVWAAVHFVHKFW